MQVHASSSSTRSYNPFVQLAASDDSHVYRGADRRAWDAAVEAWKHADAAQTALPALEAQGAAVSTRLAQERATLQALKDANSRIYGELHGGKRTGLKNKLTKLRLPAKPSSAREGSGSPTSPTGAGVRRRSTQEDFAASYPAEAKALDAVEQTQQLDAQLLDELKMARALAAAVDERFQHLRDAAVLMFPPMFVASATALSEAMRALGEEEDAAHEAHTVSFDMERACNCMQSTHLYHRKVLAISDAVKDPKSASLGSFGPLAQINTHNQYIAAKNESFRAQTCLSEGLRLLDKHQAFIPPDMRRHVAKLRDLGLGQMDQLYELLYGNAVFSGNRVSRNKQIEGLFNAQEQSFKHLTDIAVWLQKVVPDFQRALEDAALRRREARRDVVEQWDRALRNSDAREQTAPHTVFSATPPTPPPLSPIPPPVALEETIPRTFLAVQVTGPGTRPMGPRAVGKRPLPPVPLMRPSVL